MHQINNCLSCRAFYISALSDVCWLHFLSLNSTECLNFSLQKKRICPPGRGNCSFLSVTASHGESPKTTAQPSFITGGDGGAGGGGSCLRQLLLRQAEFGNTVCIELLRSQFSHPNNQLDHGIQEIENTLPAFSNWTIMRRVPPPPQTSSHNPLGFQARDGQS